ncbi:hypothetical protein PANG_00063 [Paenibacillus phage PG1]|uniref:hypothetical protein n=1 Tax=Paenibacillus phage PG1 TaxID=754053 RepID=UPI00034291DE|nr:hypothetical protein PANG_00063 [Paenibacillus phage PG1]AGN33782.1 hypothetical protein PANG_00063 [Paenibacillus phage PG1]
MIEWKKVDPNNVPEGKFLFWYDGSVFEGWAIDATDDDGYPMWEGNESFVKNAYGVRWYAEINEPPDPKEAYL